MTDKRFAELMEKRNVLDTDLKNLEKQIYDLETRYLEETANTGNIFKGWDGYLQGKNPKQGQSQRKLKINNSDRIFSLSSATSPANQLLNEELQERNVNGTQLAPAFRPKRTKKKKNYASIGEMRQQQENENDLGSSSSSDDYQGELKKKVKGSKKY